MNAKGLVRLVCLLAPLLWCGPVIAQSSNDLDRLAGTLSVENTPMISSGQLTACTLVFEHFQRDDLYLNGHFVKVSGSFGLMKTRDSVGFVMKALANDFDPQSMSSSTVDLARIYLIGADYKTNFNSLISTVPTDVPGGIFAAFQFDPSATMLLEAVSNGAVTVAIGPSAGTSDIQMTLDLTVTSTDNQGVRTHADDQGLEFFACATKLLESEAETE